MQLLHEIFPVLQVRIYLFLNYSTLLELSAAQNQFCRIRTLEASHWGTRTKTQQTDGIYIPYSNTNACKMRSVQVNQDGRAKKKTNTQPTTK